MLEVGKVIKTDKEKNTATVEFDRKSACAKCGMCMMTEDQKKVEITLKNNIGAVEEDYVEVSMGGNFVLTAALIVYVIPLILIGVALFITKRMSEEIQLISAGGSLFVGFIISFIADRLIRNRKGYTPEIINILEKSKEETENGR